MEAIELYLFDGFHCSYDAFQQSRSISSILVKRIFEYHAPRLHFHKIASLVSTSCRALGVFQARAR